MKIYREPAAVAALPDDIRTGHLAETLAEEFSAELSEPEPEEWLPEPPPALAAFLSGYVERVAETLRLVSGGGDTVPRFWELPPYYAGATFEGYLVSGIGRNRDSDTLEESNYAAALAALREAAAKAGEPSDSVQEIGASHWAVGWVEWIAIRPDAPATVAEACSILAALECYPVLDDFDYSERENEEAAEWWESFGRGEALRVISEALAEAAAESGYPEAVAELVSEALAELDGEVFDGAFYGGGMAGYEVGSEGAYFPPEALAEWKAAEGWDFETLAGEALALAEAADRGARTITEALRVADPVAPPPSPGILAGIRAAAREAARAAARFYSEPRAPEPWRAALQEAARPYFRKPLTPAEVYREGYSGLSALFWLSEPGA